MSSREIEDPVLGILGEMGTEATINFQQELLAETPAETDQDHIVTLVSNDPKIPDRNAAIRDGSDSPLPRLQINAITLEESGADVIAMPCNTAHYYYDDLKSNIEADFINMIQTASTTLEQNGVERVGLLATKTVLDVGIYDSYFANSSVDLVAPEDRSRLMEAIYAVKRGDHREATQTLSPVIEYFEHRDCEALLIGCSDLSVLSIESELTEYDPITLLARESVEQLNEREVFSR